MTEQEATEQYGEFVDKVLNFITKCGSWHQIITEKRERIKVLKNEIKVSEQELYSTFDEWNHLPEGKEKDKLEWKRNKIGVDINPKIYEIQGLELEIKEIHNEVLSIVENGYTE